jgi:hypothetical protein
MKLNLNKTSVSHIVGGVTTQIQRDNWQRCQPSQIQRDNWQRCQTSQIQRDNWQRCLPSL